MKRRTSIPSATDPGSSDWPEQPRVAAIGEVGLDFHYDFSPREKQIEVLRWMLELGRRLSLPVILHNRESGSEMLRLLRGLPRRERPGVFHSFTENAEFGRGGARARLLHFVLRHDHFSGGREHPRGGVRLAAGGDADRDRYALPRARARTAERRTSRRSSSKRRGNWRRSRESISLVSPKSRRRTSRSFSGASRESLNLEF